MNEIAIRQSPKDVWSEILNERDFTNADRYTFISPLERKVDQIVRVEHGGQFTTVSGRGYVESYSPDPDAITSPIITLPQHAGANSREFAKDYARYGLIDRKNMAGIRLMVGGTGIAVNIRRGVAEVLDAVGKGPVYIVGRDGENIPLTYGFKESVRFAPLAMGRDGILGAVDTDEELLPPGMVLVISPTAGSLARVREEESDEIDNGDGTVSICIRHFYQWIRWNDTAPRVWRAWAK